MRGPLTFADFCKYQGVSEAEREALFVFLLAHRLRKILRG